VLVEAGAALAQSPRAPLEPTDARATSASERAATRSAGTDAPALVEPAASPAFGFETGSADPSSAGWSASGAAAIVDERASEGTRSLRLDGRSRPARARLRIAAPRVEGNRIRISFDAAADDAAALTALARVDGPDGLLFVERRDLPLGPGWSRRAIDVPVLDDAAEISLLLAADAGIAWIDALAIDGASTLERPPPSREAERYIDFALELIERHSLYRERLDGPAFRRAVLDQARGARTPADAHFAVRYAIGRLGDTHGWLRTADRAAVLERAPVSNARSGRPPIEPEGRLLPGGAAYLLVPGFAGGTHAQQVEFAETLEALIRSLGEADACGWIVDLRRNSGGNLWPMLLGLGPLLGDGDSVVAIYPDGRRETAWHRGGTVGLGEFARLRIRGEPYRVQPAPRVALLTGPETASAGEVLALALHGSGTTRLFGAETAGATTGTRTFVLPDGAELVLAVVTIGDRDGRPQTGPLRPDEPVEPGVPEAPLVEQPAVRAALDWLAAGPFESCARSGTMRGHSANRAR